MGKMDMMMGMSIRELDVFMFSTFPWTNELSSRGCQILSKEGSGWRIWKKETHVLPLLCIRTPVDKGTHSLIP